jgi:hypothetical protein
MPPVPLLIPRSQVRALSGPLQEVPGRRGFLLQGGGRRRVGLRSVFGDGVDCLRHARLGQRDRPGKRRGRPRPARLTHRRTAAFVARIGRRGWRLIRRPAEKRVKGRPWLRLRHSNWASDDGRLPWTRVRLTLLPLALPPPLLCAFLAQQSNGSGGATGGQHGVQMRGRTKGPGGGAFRVYGLRSSRR